MQIVLIALLVTLAVVAVLAGIGFGLAFGWRNARDIALERYRGGSAGPSNFLPAKRYAGE